MADSNSWYAQGYEAVAAEEAKMDSGGDAQRFFMKPETGREIIFLDDAPFLIHEHQATINGDFKNYFTCLKGSSEEVPCCEKLGLKSAYAVGYYTVIDCTKVVGKEDKVYQYEVKLLPAKFGSMKLLKRKAEDATGDKQTTGLKGKMFKLYRTDKKSPTIGDEYTYARDVELEKVFAVANFGGKKLSEMWTKAGSDSAALEKLKKIFKVQIGEDGKLVNVPVPFNYMERLKPKDARDLKIILKNAQPGKFDEAKNAPAGPSGADADVPF